MTPRLVKPVAGLIVVTNTHTQTDHTTSVPVEQPDADSIRQSLSEKREHVSNFVNSHRVDFCKKTV